MQSMSSLPRFLMLCAALAATFCAPAAHAYRPFEGTDASVAEPGVFELEFSPFGYLRSRSGNTLFGPAAVGNFGLAGNTEIVIEGRTSRQQGGVPESYRATLGDTALSVKHLFREGSLQEGTGLSLAAECGVLLPEYHGQDGTGAICTGIASQRFDHAIFHFNAAVGRTRDHNTTHLLGVIVEGNPINDVRPVLEVFGENEHHVGHTRSALVGVIWKQSEEMSFDLGVRRARADGELLTELRAGLTWSFAMHQ